MSKPVYIASRKGNIAAYEYGEGPAVIFLHGGPGDTHHYMARMAEPLFAKYRCIFFDQRGTGLSDNFPRKPDNFDVGHLLFDLNAVRTHFELERPALVGHSWGAIYGLFACIDSPDLWGRAALICMGPLNKDFEQKTSENLKNLISNLAPEEQKTWNTLWAERNFACDSGDQPKIKEADQKLTHLRIKARIFDPSSRSEFLDDHSLDPPCDREVNKWIWSKSEGWFSWEKLMKASTLPLWICTGKNDAVPLSQTEQFLRFAQESSSLIIDNCGHFPWIDSPNLFYSSLKRFLQKNTQLVSTLIK